MSVQLVIATLLAVAAVATTSDDAKVNVVMVKTCAVSSCECDSATATTQNYTVGKCTTVSDKHWKVDSCTPDGADDITLKGYSSDACTDEEKTISATCSPILYQQATCETSSDGTTTATVKLFINCSTAECSAATAEARMCKPAITFTVGSDSTVTPKCAAFGTKYLKLETMACPSGGNEDISFKVFSDDKCGEEVPADKKEEGRVFKPKADGTAFNVKKACTASYYRQGVCTATNTASVKTCPAKEGASDCNADCVDMPLELGKPWKVGDKDWVIDSCDASTDLKFKVYSGWKTYKATCSTDGSGKAMAACVAPQSKVDPQPNPNPKPKEHTKSKSEPEPEAPQGNTSAANTSDSDEPSDEKTTSASADNSSNNSGVDDGIAVPTLSAGVLLVLGVLECAFLL